MEVLAFDVGESIVGILDVNTGAYAPYRGEDMIDGARRLIDCEGIIVSFNGTLSDLPSLARILGVEAGALELNGIHRDMREIASKDRWPPDPGTSPILGTSLVAAYEHYLDEDVPRPPTSVSDGYEEDNWRDCWMAGELWKKLCHGAFGEEAGAGMGHREGAGGPLL